ncbi:MAG: AAA family ATPase, partial [Alistipes sp.]|nr:AAA family ATPase [Alistipes sp.]
MEKDEIFETAERYVKSTGKSIFLTGRAGTGKTTFLKYIAETTSKHFVILAPTGVAAINAGGTTIHSFFHLPLCPYLPDVKELITEYQLPERYHSLSKERIKIIRALDLLIIDEISMVRADLLDAVDVSLRRYRRNDQPFGGVQLLMIGDVHQLSPVVKDSERQYISQVYPSPFFFH